MTLKTSTQFTSQNIGSSASLPTEKREVNKRARFDIENVLKTQGVSLVRYWLVAAKQSGFSKEESRIVLEEASSGDYFKLVETLRKYSSKD